MLASVVVPTFRRPELLASCLAALARQDLLGEWEVIVSDDANEPAIRHQVERLTDRIHHIRYVPVTGCHGPAAARNAGWRLARGEIVAFTDDDCLPDSGWLAAGVAPFVDPLVIAVTGQTIVPLGPAPTDHERNTAGLELSEFITANCFCRRMALEAVGGFDERFTLAWREDSDLHFRLLDAGGRIERVPAAVVIHPARPGRFCSSLREQRKAMFDALLYRKHTRHFRARIQPRWPANYYAIAAALIASASALMLGRPVIAAVLASVWLALTLWFCVRRLRGTSLQPRHIAEMLLTSSVIPFISIFWRLYGGVRFRVLFW
jgi:GT2 family glycosyltransferase